MGLRTQTPVVDHLIVVAGFHLFRSAVGAYSENGDKTCHSH
jgi:hypothetical protein